MTPGWTNPTAEHGIRGPNCVPGRGSYSKSLSANGGAPRAGLGHAHPHTLGRSDHPSLPLVCDRKKEFSRKRSLVVSGAPMWVGGLLQRSGLPSCRARASQPPVDLFPRVKRRPAWARPLGARCVTAPRRPSSWGRCSLQRLSALARSALIQRTGEALFWRKSSGEKQKAGSRWNTWLLGTTDCGGENSSRKLGARDTVLRTEA